jgi:uncharacterized protein
VDDRDTPSHLITVTIAGPAGPLEGLLQEREAQDHALTALVCHPHPLYGGTLHNKVVHRVASTLHALGAAVLRFNFRGVGKSAGDHDEGRGELEDARAVLEFLRGRYPRARRWLAGFSFGAWIAARLAVEERDIERLILVAPPVTRSEFDMLRRATVPKLVVQGTADDLCLPGDLATEFPTWAEPKTLVTIEGAGHFFDRQLTPLGEALRAELADAAGESHLT